MSEISNKSEDNCILSPTKTNIDVRHCVRPEKKVRKAPFFITIYKSNIFLVINIMHELIVKL